MSAAKGDAATEAGRDRVRGSCLAVTDRADRCGVAREGLAAGDRRMVWRADSMAPELDLRAFRDGRP
ncbi:hypothetical protein [Streptomyces pilosus]|uniref:hypothetical protein n=1 Tax=Streptomyces pilosus TaxID=28893 RepID=UPI0036399D1E